MHVERSAPRLKPPVPAQPTVFKRAASALATTRNLAMKEVSL
jgi:hypothetical protein